MVALARSATEFFAILLAAWLATGLTLAVVMGRRGHGAFQWFFLGAVLGPLALPLAWSAIRDEGRAAARPTAEGTPSSGSVDVLVGIDGSAEAVDALRAAIRLVGANVGRLTLASVVTFDETSGQARRDEERAAALLEEAASSVEDPRSRPRTAVGSARGRAHQSRERGGVRRPRDRTSRSRCQQGPAREHGGPRGGRADPDADRVGAPSECRRHLPAPQGLEAARHRPARAGNTPPDKRTRGYGHHDRDPAPARRTRETLLGSYQFTPEGVSARKGPDLPWALPFLTCGYSEGRAATGWSGGIENTPRSTLPSTP